MVLNSARMKACSNLSSRCVWGASLFGLLLAPREAQSNQVHGVEIAVPSKLVVGQSIALPPTSVFRTNAAITALGFAQDSERAAHQVTLIEFHLRVPVAGRFALRGRVDAKSPCPTLLTLDGNLVARLFDKESARAATTSTLGDLVLSAGSHVLRLTTQDVDLPLPRLDELSLVMVQASPAFPAEQALTVLPRRPVLSKGWDLSTSRKIHMDFHTGAFVKGVAKNFDADRFCETLARANVNAVTVFAKDMHGYSYYDTKIGTRHPGLSFDLLRAQVRACKARGIKVMAYYSIGFDSLYATTEEGKPAVHKHFVTLIPSAKGAYLETYVYPMLQEIARGYDVDGFFIDFAEHEPFFDEARKRIKDIDPGLAIAFNQQWEKPHKVIEGLDSVEIESWEHGQNLYRYQYLARYLRDIVPVPIMATRFATTWGDFGGLNDVAALRYAARVSAAAGGTMIVGDQMHPFGQLDPAVYQRVGKVFSEVKKLEPELRGASPLPYVAILHGGSIAVPLVTDAGLSFSVVDSTQPLGSYCAVVIGDASKIEDATVPALEDYVKAGGRLLISGTPRPSLAELAGLSVDSVPEAIAYTRIGSPVFVHTPAFDHWGAFAAPLLKPVAGTSTLAPLVLPLGHNTSHWVSHLYNAPQEHASTYAAISMRSVGRGQIAYFATPVFTAYARSHAVVARQMFLDVFDSMVPANQRLVQVSAPVALETALQSRRGGLLLHLVHGGQSRRATYSPEGVVWGPSSPVMDESGTVADVTVTLPVSVVGHRQARVIPSGQKLKGHRKGDLMQWVLPAFQVGTIIAFD
jgi:hypothetical protein